MSMRESSRNHPVSHTAHRRRLASRALIVVPLLLMLGCGGAAKRAEMANRLVASVGQGDKRQVTNTYVDFDAAMNKPFGPGRKKENRPHMQNIKRGLHQWNLGQSLCDQAKGLEVAISGMSDLDAFARSEVQAAGTLKRLRNDIDVQLTTGLSSVESTLIRKNAVAAEEELTGMEKVCPDDERMKEARSRIGALARKERTQRSESAFVEGRQALAYLLVVKDPSMTLQDRKWMRQRHDATIQALKEQLKVKMAIVGIDANAIQLAQTAISDRQSVFISSQDAYKHEAVIPVTVTVRQMRTADPVRIATRGQTQRYISGKKWVHNDAKDQCNLDAGNLQNAASRAQGAIESARFAMNTCIEAAQRCKRQAAQAGGFAGVLASAACGIGEAACRSPYNNAVNAARTADGNANLKRSQCAGMSNQKQVNVYAQHPYSVSTWEVKSRAAIDITLQLTPKKSITRTLVADLVEQDDVVQPEPKYGVEVDSLELPSKSSQKATLLKSLKTQLVDALDAQARDYWRIKRDAANRAASRHVREDLQAEVWAMTDLLGIRTAAALADAERFAQALSHSLPRKGPGAPK